MTTSNLDVARLRDRRHHREGPQGLAHRNILGPIPHIDRPANLFFEPLECQCQRGRIGFLLLRILGADYDVESRFERLDYSKGILLKLNAFERFLEQNPARAQIVTLLQILVPSRLETPEYRTLKSEIEEAVGRINGRYGRPGVTPIEYVHRGIPANELAALYRFADAALVTPQPTDRQHDGGNRSHRHRHQRRALVA